MVEGFKGGREGEGERGEGYFGAIANFSCSLEKEVLAAINEA